MHHPLNVHLYAYTLITVFTVVSTLQNYVFAYLDLDFTKYVTRKVARIIVMPKLRIVKVAFLVTPVFITIYDQIGYVGIVRGCSMQVRNFRSCILQIPCTLF